MAGISNLLSKTGNFKIPVNTSELSWTIIPIIAGLYHSCQKPVKTSFYTIFVPIHFPEIRVPVTCMSVTGNLNCQDLPLTGV